MISKDSIMRFLDFRENTPSTIRGRLMYDVKGHYKYLTEIELFNYYFSDGYDILF
jgi:hypothetical protein